MKTWIYLWCLAAALTASAANPGDEVVVVYNTKLPESKDVARHYADVRQVPADHVIGFALPVIENMSRKEFENLLQKPLVKALEDKKLWRFGQDRLEGTNGEPARMVPAVKQSKIRYLVLCYGVPVDILEDEGLKETATENLRPEVRRNEAAVDSELALLPRVRQGLPLGGPLSNPFYTVTNAAVLQPTNGILMVARLDGPTAESARALVDKAVTAEKEGLWGRAYFDLRGNAKPGYKLGDDWIQAASEICRRLGFETTVDTNYYTFQPEFPMSQIAYYCGWYDENVSGPFARQTVEFAPGAFAYHLHSFSAVPLRSTTNRWVGPLIYKGATCTMGCVAEPFLSGTPDLATFTGRFIFLGFSFGEAAYASQSVLSWQITVVGDPLYRPFARPPQEVHAELERTHGKNLDWSYLRLMNINLAAGKPETAVAEFLEQLPLTKQSAVLTEKLADIYADEGKPSSALETYQKALERNPSHEQRLRLRLNIKDRLKDSGETQVLYEDLEKLNLENPDYPARFEILRDMLNTGMKMGSNATTRAVQEMLKYNAEMSGKKE